MFASIKTAATYTHAIASAIAILAFSSESCRQQEIAAAKARIARRIAESQQQQARAKQAIEQELQAMKAEIVQPIEPAMVLRTVRSTIETEQPIAPQPELATMPTEPVTLAIEPTPQRPTKATAKKPKPFPTVAKPTIDYSKLSIRELKKLASERKIKRYSSLTKSELITALTTV